MMTLLHIIPALTKGGAESFVISLCNEAAKRGDEITLLLGSFEKSKDRLAELHKNVKVVFINDSFNNTFWLYVLAFKWVLSENFAKYGIVHGHLTFGAFVTTLCKLKICAQKSKTKCVETNHSVGMPIKAKQKLFFRWNAIFRDVVILVADDLDWSIFNKNHPNLVVKTIKNGVSFPCHTEINAQLCDSQVEKKLIIGNIGRLVSERSPQKLLQVFIDVLARLKRNDILIHIGGDGPLIDELRGAVKNQNLSERIIFLGLINQPSEMLATLDLYVSINVREMTGIAGLEAVSENVPVVSLQMDPEYFGENDEIWSGHHSSLVEKIATLAESVSERESLRSLQYAYVQDHLSISKTYTEYRKIYKSIG